MSKEIVISNYIQEKFNKIEKDLFLEEISQLSIIKQRDMLIKEINAIEYYIKIIKSNSDCYINIDMKKVLKSSIKEYLNDLKKIIKKYHEYYKYLNLLEYHKDKNNHIDDKIESESLDSVLNSNQIEILNELDRTNIDCYDFNDLVSIIKFLIQHFDIQKTVLIKLILDKIEKEFINSNYSDNKFIAFSSIKNVLNYKINCLDKNDTDRKSLKEIKKSVKNIIDLSKEQKSKNHDYRIDIINILLDNEIYLNKLITRCPDFLNLIDEENHTFAYTLITKYLDSYLLELHGKQSKISKEKYLQTYYTLLKKPNYLHKEIDRTKVEVLFNNFKERIENDNIKRKKYLEVCQMLDDILQNDKKEKIDNDIINFETKNILNSQLHDKRRNLCDEYTIVITDSKDNLYNYAYSIMKNEKENYLLRLHITDISTFIKKNSYIDNALKEVIFATTDGWLEEKMLEKFSLKKDRETPVITLECEIKDNQIYGFQCYKSNIVVDDVYSFEDFNNEVLNKKMLEYLKLGYLLNNNLDSNNYSKSLVDTFDMFFLNQVGAYFGEHDLPYIYKIQPKQNGNNYLELLKELNGLFGKVNKDDANIFYSIVCGDINYSIYSSEPNHHNELKQRYYNDLFKPLYSYVGIYQQYLLEDFMIKNDINKDMLKEKYKEEIEDLIRRANTKKEEKRANNQKKLKI